MSNYKDIGMKKILIIFTGLLFFHTLSSQIGVNTENPQKLLHINGGNAGTTTDDVVVTDNGTVGIGTINPNENLKLQVEGKLLNSVNEGEVTTQGNNYVGGNLDAAKIGIGTVSPEAPLHIVAGASEAPLRLADGSEDESALLTADASGYAFWDALRPMSSTIRGTFLTGTIQTSGDTSAGRSVSNRIRLSPGKWLIFARVVTTGNLSGFYMYLILSQASGTTRTPLSRVGAYASTSSPYIAANQLLYLVEISTVTEYELGLSSSRTGTLSSAHGNYFYAVRLDRN